MAKKPSKSKAKQSRAKPEVSKAAPTFTLDDFTQSVEELVRLGVIKVALNEHGDDAVFVVVPEGLRVSEVVDQETQSAEDRLLIEEHTLPARVESLLRVKALAAWRSFARFKMLPVLESVTGRTPQQLNKVFDGHHIEAMALPFLEQLVFLGFDLALNRYAEQIKHVPELAGWNRKRHDGLGKGHATQTQARKENYQRIRDTWAQLEAEGKPCTYDAVAAICKCSRATVDRAINNRTATRPKR
jgi:hypothetical protein